MLFLLLTAIIIGSLLSSKLIDKKTSKNTNRTESAPSQERTDAIAKNRIRKALLEIENSAYTVLIRKLQDDEEVLLIPNFKEALSSVAVLSSNHCNFIINGGFYTKENSPLGLFFLRGEKIAGYVESSFLNGSISKYREGPITLSSGRPELLNDLEFALQSGPYFSLESGAMTRFEDGKARRSLIAEDSWGKIYFLAVYNSSDTFSGPDLSQLKKILMVVSESHNLELISAINLDGGSTLAFLQTGEDSIPEIKKSGSFFCLKNK